MFNNLVNRLIGGGSSPAASPSRSESIEMSGGGELGLGAEVQFFGDDEGVGSGKENLGDGLMSGSQLSQVSQKGSTMSQTLALPSQSQKATFSQKQRPGFRPPASVSAAFTAKVSSQPKQVEKLINHPTKLKKQDVTCPICWSVLFEPTTLPCNHSLCKACFLKHVDETSINCPCCRRRLSVWSRRVTRDDELLDVELWKKIQEEFPDLVEARVSGRDSPKPPPELLSSACDYNKFVRDGEMDPPAGVILKELQETLVPHVKDIESQRLQEEAASAELIQKIQSEEVRQFRSRNVSQDNEEESGNTSTSNEPIRPSAETPSSSARTATSCARNLMKDFASVAQDRTATTEVKTEKAKPKTTVKAKAAPLKPNESVAKKVKKTEAKEDSTPAPKKAKKSTAKGDSAPASKKAKKKSTNKDDSAPAPKKAKKIKAKEDSTPAPKNAKKKKPSLKITSDTESSDDEDTISLDDTISDDLNQSLDSQMIAELTSQIDAATEGNADTTPSNDKDNADGKGTLPYSPFSVKLRMHTDDYVPPSAEKKNPAINNTGDQDQDTEEVVLGEDEYFYLEKEANLLEFMKKKAEQEAQDRAVAEQLQQCYEMGIDDPRGRSSGNEYSLRSWKRGS